MTRQNIESLESRCLLAAHFFESEPNGSMASADAVPRIPDGEVRVSGTIGSTGGKDLFKFKLKAGDVFGAAVIAKGRLDTNARLLNAAGKVLMANDDSQETGVNLLPAESPLPKGRGTWTDSEIYRVIARTGTYYLEVSAPPAAKTVNQRGKYEIDLMVARPALEKERVGAHQVLFLDFDGSGPLSWRDYASPGSMSPLVDFLPGFNLSPSDEDAVIDKVIERVTTLLTKRVRTAGLNGHYHSSRRPGEFGLEIRNSRDHRDTFGKDPFVSRIVVGGTAAEAGFTGDSQGILGLAENTDVGNFMTDDQAVATLSWITDAVDLVSAAAPLTQVELMATGIAYLVVHEAGHLFGCLHTDQADNDFYGGVSNVMDPGVTAFIGPDFVLGTDDDPGTRLAVDGYDSHDVFNGINDPVNTLAFGLSTGTLTSYSGRASVGRNVRVGGLSHGWTEPDRWGA